MNKLGKKKIDDSMNGGKGILPTGMNLKKWGWSNEL